MKISNFRVPKSGTDAAPKGLCLRDIINNNCLFPYMHLNLVAVCHLLIIQSITLHISVRIISTGSQPPVEIIPTERHVNDEV